MEKINHKVKPLPFPTTLERNDQTKTENKGLINKAKSLWHIANNPTNRNLLKAPRISKLTLLQNCFNGNYLFANGHDHILLGSNKQFKLYLRISVWYARLVPSKCLFYRINDGRNITPIKLTKANILDDFSNTIYEQKLIDYLSKYSLYKQSKNKRSYRIVELFEPYTT